MKECKDAGSLSGIFTLLLSEKQRIIIEMFTITELLKCKMLNREEKCLLPSGRDLIMRGKQKCKILKEIRQRIADENGIPYITSECRHKGECRGTCPKCESELRYLEQQLSLRASMGKRVTVAALCAGMALTAAGCVSGNRTADQDDQFTELGGAVTYEETETSPEPEIYVTSGEVAWTDDGTEEVENDTQQEGDIVDIPDDLTGYVYAPETQNNG